MDAAAYDRVAAAYVAMVPADPNGETSVLAIATRALLQALRPTSGLQILDLGCGEGHVARHVQASGGTVVGIDISEALLAVARERTRGVRLLHADAQDLAPFPDHSFDLVYCNLALMDIPNLSATYAAVARVLRAGGRFVFTLVHPCFCPPGGEIAPDADGRIHAAIVRRYTEEAHWTAGRAGAWRKEVGAYHRTLSTYVNGLLSAGFTLLRMEEPVAPNRPDLSGIAELWARIPPVLLVEARHA